jgi:hypothetical protein
MVSDCRLNEMDDPNIGLCVRCRYARTQRSAKGMDFWRCGRSDTDASFLRYPPLPVRGCDGFEVEDSPGEDSDRRRRR